MEKINVKLVGPDSLYPIRKNLAVGTSVRITKDEGNKFSNTALKVLYNDQIIGFVGEKEDVSEGTISAKELHNMFTDNEFFTAVITSVLPTARNNTPMVLHVLVNPVVNNMDGTEEMSDVKIELGIGGTRAANKELASLTADVAIEENPIQAIITVEGDKIIVGYNGGKGGSIRKDDMLKVIGHDTIAELDYSRFVSFLETERAGKNKPASIEVSMDGKKKLVATLQLSVSEVDELFKVKGEGIAAEMERILNEGITTKENLERIVAVMEDANFEEDMIIRLLATFIIYTEDWKERIPNEPETLFIGEELVYDVLFYAGMGSKGRHLLFEGDKGLGKNHLAEQAAWMLQRPLVEISVNIGSDNSSILGTQTVTYDTDGRMNIGFDPQVLLDGAEVGAIVVMDEFNTGLAEVFSGLNSLWDKRRRLTVAGYKTIEAHRNFLTIATMNPFYTATSDLNEATAERFIPIIFDGQVQIKKIIKGHFPEVKAPYVDSIVTVYKDMIAMRNNGRIDDKSITIRGLIDAAEATLYGMGLQRALITNVANRARDIDDRRSITSLIKDNVASN
ncbi:AAA family ATPase [Lysinibacillus sp. UGB7]|uniref:AAA family ATPase n=1 Tax=Lysinibacillus sp. UGB7 TaxID=3411039 RepID=UPI003B79F91D